jgi:hypothetical protein
LNVIVFKDYVDIKGDKGEAAVNKILQEEGGFLLMDYTFYQKRTSVQVDHIFISSKGLFVIETKNWSGRIVGEEWADNWLQYNNGVKKQMYNPVLQNWRHIERLKERLKEFISLADLPIYNVIVFPNKDAKPEVYNEQTYEKLPADTPVLTLGRLRRYLRSRKTLISEKQQTKLHEILKLNIYAFIDRKEHEANVKFYRRKIR